MQTVPDVMDISKESQKTLDAYGAQVGGASWQIIVCWHAGWPRKASASYNCLTGAGITMAPIQKKIFVMD